MYVVSSAFVRFINTGRTPLDSIQTRGKNNRESIQILLSLQGTRPGRGTRMIVVRAND